MNCSDVDGGDEGEEQGGERWLAPPVYPDYPLMSNCRCCTLCFPDEISLALAGFVFLFLLLSVVLPFPRLLVVSFTFAGSMSLFLLLGVVLPTLWAWLFSQHTDFRCGFALEFGTNFPEVSGGKVMQEWPRKAVCALGQRLLDKFVVHYARDFCSVVHEKFLKEGTLVVVKFVGFVAP